MVFDLDLLPTIMTYIPNLAKVKANLHVNIKVAGHMVQLWNMDRQMDGQTLPSALSSLSYMLEEKSFLTLIGTDWKTNTKHFLGSFGTPE